MEREIVAPCRAPCVLMPFATKALEKASTEISSPCFFPRSNYNIPHLLVSVTLRAAPRCHDAAIFSHPYMALSTYFWYSFCVGTHTAETLKMQTSITRHKELG
jgi:hypothetical protein